jgi:hypothetical protein
MTSNIRNLLILVLLVTTFSCKTGEERIYDYSYTNEWHYIDTMRFQVYQTKNGRRYIIVLNNRETRFIRQYIK